MLYYIFFINFNQLFLIGYIRNSPVYCINSFFILIYPQFIAFAGPKTYNYLVS